MQPSSLPDAEQDVLATLYELGEATARQIREHLAPRRPMAHPSVVTLLSRLKNKGLVSRRKSKQGKAFVFAPTRPKTRAFGPLVSGFLRRAFSGSTAALVASLFETRPPNTKELKELEELLADWRERQQEKRSR